MQLNVILAFLIGSIPTGYLLNKYFGHGDIRKVGSGNIGATNVLRHSGKLLGLLTLLIDVSKGFLAVVWLDRISVKGSSFVVDGEVVIFVIGSSVVLGHIFSPWLKFKGGKGVATMLGVILYISHSCYKSCSSIDMYYFLDFRNNIFFVSIFSWLMIIFFTRYVALGSVISLTIATIYSFFYLPDLFLFFALMTLLITYKHKDNFERIKNKTEHKISF
jgi:glycerol-3-phosphate acyltransferase PlsY